jgi:hypothetical protein
MVGVSSKPGSNQFAYFPKKIQMRFPDARWKLQKALTCPAFLVPGVI